MYGIPLYGTNGKWNEILYLVLRTIKNISQYVPNKLISRELQVILVGEEELHHYIVPYSGKIGDSPNSGPKMTTETERHRVTQRII